MDTTFYESLGEALLGTNLLAKNMSYLGYSMATNTSYLQWESKQMSCPMKDFFLPHALPNVTLTLCNQSLDHGYQVEKDCFAKVLKEVKQDMVQTQRLVISQTT